MELQRVGGAGDGLMDPRRARETLEGRRGGRPPLPPASSASTTPPTPDALAGVALAVLGLPIGDAGAGPPAVRAPRDGTPVAHGARRRVPCADYGDVAGRPATPP